MHPTKSVAMLADSSMSAMTEIKVAIPGNPTAAARKTP
jgi:hypothetical protein